MLKFNGEYWYEAPSLAKRIRKWFFWIGGWEKANQTGWQLWRTEKVLPKLTSEQKELIKDMPQQERNRYAATLPKKTKRVWRDPFPISFLGHRITFYGWGLSVRLRYSYLVMTWKTQDKSCYLSTDGTSTNAHAWYWGAPRVIQQAARKRNESYSDFETREKPDWTNF